MNYIICEITIDDKLSCEENNCIVSFKKEKRQSHSEITSALEFQHLCIVLVPHKVYLKYNKDNIINTVWGSRPSF